MKPYKKQFNENYKENMYRSFLTERTYNIKKDVDMIYKKAFKKFVDAFKKKEITPFILKVMLKLPIAVIKSESFTSPDGKAAHALDPISIVCGINDITSHYDPLGKDTDRYSISITPDFEAVIAIIENGYDIEKVTDLYDLGNTGSRAMWKKQLEMEVSEIGIKSNISHELIHWIDDVAHGKFLKARTLKAKDVLDNSLLPDDVKEKIINEIMNQGKPHRYMSDTEVNAMIHQIESLKNKLGKQWDTLTLEDVFSQTGLYTLAQDVYSNVGRSGYYTWQKQIVTRLSREKLLGKNMKKFVAFESVLRRYNKFKKLLRY